MTENGVQRTDNRLLIALVNPNAKRCRGLRKLIYRRSHRPSRGLVSSDHPSSVLRLPHADWWSQTGSNRRPHACKARALPTELWPRRRTEDRRRRTEKIRPSSSSVLRRPTMVGLGGLEPPTSRLSSARSN